ncbi:putative DNA topoisomerase [Cocos nucifera]|nr:putative DNA topoisomerase [Cocos nucifera]
MGSEESIGSCAPASKPAVGVSREEPKCPQRTPDRPSYQENVCFGCNQEGHWVRDCPLRAKRSPGFPDPAAAATASAGAAGGRRYPARQCPCGRGPCIVLTSWTDRNPGRDFYRCPVKSVSFFPSSSTSLFSKSIRRLRWVLFFQGQGACNHFQWVDSPAKLSEKMDDNLGEDSVPNFSLVPEEPKKPEMDDGTKNGALGRLGLIECDWCGQVSFFPSSSTSLFSKSIRRLRWVLFFQGQGACNHFQWVDSPAKLSEKMDDNLGEDSVPNFSLVPEEPKKPEMDDGTKNGALGENGHPTLILVPEPKEARMGDGGAGEAMNEDKPGEMLEMLPQASIVPESPPLSPKRQNQPNIMPELSGIERVSLHGDSPGASRPGKCYRCGKEGHWMSECIASPNSPCFKCGRFGHSRKACTG